VPPPAARLLDAPRINEVSWEEDRPVCSPPLLDLDEATLLFEVPAAWGELCRADPTAARTWHGLARDVFEAYLARRYRAVDLLTVKEKGRPRPRYVLYRFPSSPSGDLTFL
jgi:predicted GNAT superfamily acetyltransferase